MSSNDERRDPLIRRIAEYVHLHNINSSEAYGTARLALADSIGCAALARKVPECSRLLGCLVPGTRVEAGCRVPWVDDSLDLVTGTFDLAMMIRWLDYNDTWLAVEWGHPSDNIGAILAICDYLSRNNSAVTDEMPRMRDVLGWMIKAYEIQGMVALDNSFNGRGLDHVILVKLASAAVSSCLLGATLDQTMDVLSHVWIDNGALRVYRQSPNTGSRKSWAAADAAARGVYLTLLVLAGEPGYRTPLSAPVWGFQDTVFDGKPLRLSHELGSYVMENILFKVAFPAEFHGQTAVECALRLYTEVRDRVAEITRIVIKTQESAKRIIDKDGPLRNPADRDHCIQYMVAVALLFGRLTADDYRDETAGDERIERLRDLTVVEEEPRFSVDYLDPQKRSIANSVQVFFSDGSATDEMLIEYPLGHRRRRSEALEPLREKLESNLLEVVTEERAVAIVGMFEDPATFDSMRVHDFVDRLSSP